MTLEQKYCKCMFKIYVRVENCVYSKEKNLMVHAIKTRVYF